MAKAAVRRDLVVERAADFVLAHGLAAASLRPLAAAAGTSDRMLLYYFPDKDALVAAVLERVAARMMAALAGMPAAPMPPAALEAALMALTADAALAPYMAVWLEMAARAARGDAVCRRVGGVIAGGFVDWIAARVAGDRAVAVRVLQQVEGAVLLRSLGA